MATYFVTGYPGFLGRQLVAHIAREDPQGKLFLLVQPKLQEEARRQLDALGGVNAELLSGDVVDMHLGLSGEEYRRVCDEVTDLFHLAAISYLGVPKETAWQVNVDGTRNVLELGRDCAHLRRLNHFSTCYVAGDRVGVVAEDELESGQNFRNAYEETKFHAEKLVRAAMKELPCTIYRPSSVVGDSKTGEIDRFDGPYYLGILLVTSPVSVPLPLPGEGVAPLNVVPVDFVIQAVWAISRDERAVGKTFHLVDPNPMSTRRVYELVAARSNKKLPKFHLSAKATDMVLRLPGLEKMLRPQRAAVTYVNQLALFNCHNTLEVLDGTGVRCPPLSSYLDRLVDFAKAHYRQQREAAELEDPLDAPPESR